VPDIVCRSPNGLTTYIIDVHTAWNLHMDSFVNYEETRSLVVDGEREKRESWRVALRRNHRHVAHTTPVTRFVPFIVEIFGAWGPAARRFHKEALAHVNGAFDIEYFHWSSPRFTAFWRQAFSVCTAHERGRIGLAAFKGDWARRIQAFDLLEFPGSGVVAN
jgi:hypothetical protein